MNCTELRVEMDNNHLYIQCRGCGEKIAFLHGFDDETHYSEYDEYVVEFIDAHIETCGIESLSLATDKSLLAFSDPPFEKGHPDTRYGGVSRKVEVKTDQDHVYLARWNSVHEKYKLLQEPVSEDEVVIGWRWALPEYERVGMLIGVDMYAKTEDVHQAKDVLLRVYDKLNE